MGGRESRDWGHAVTAMARRGCAQERNAEPGRYRALDGYGGESSGQASALPNIAGKKQFQHVKLKSVVAFTGDLTGTTIVLDDRSATALFGAGKSSAAACLDIDDMQSSS